MEQVRCLHTATLLPDGRIVLAGGHQGNFEVPSAVEFYAPGATPAADPQGRRIGGFRPAPPQDERLLWICVSSLGTLRNLKAIVGTRDGTRG